METITLTVNTTIDENDGAEVGTGLSLREAIDIANQSPENNHIIELQGGATYTLTVDSGDESDNHLDIEQGNVTIRATGNERAIIDASGLENPDVVLHVFGDANVNLENLTLTGGVAAGSQNNGGLTSGGGLFVGGQSTVTVTNSAIAGNSASTGGGVYAGAETTVTLIDSEVGDNQSNFNGGGIYTDSGNFTLRNSKVTGNTVTDGPPSDKSGVGGGIVVRGGTTNILETTIAGNDSVYDSGGGIAVISAEVNVYFSSIVNNTSNSSGAGIHVTGIIGQTPPLVNVVNSTISGNVADYVGGGIYLDYFVPGDGLAVIVQNSTITDNVANANLDRIAGGAGGGIATGENNRIAVLNSIVTGNFDGRNNTLSDVSGFFYTDFAFGNLGGYRGILGDGSNIVGTLDLVGGTIGTGSDIVSVDPLITPLQDNGGATQTHALLENSPAINAGNNEFIPADSFDLDDDGNTEEPIPLDQTNSDRIFNDTVDIGAVEFGSTSNTPDIPDFDNDDPNIVYRFFNNDTGVHFYTANETERDAVLKLDNFSFEGGCYRAIDSLTGMPEPSPVYRFLNKDTEVHLYTVSEVERDNVEELDNFSFEGEAFFAYETQVEDSIPIYRFFNPTTGAHFYTPSEAERDNVEANLPDFQSEGIAYYALPLESEII